MRPPIPYNEVIMELTFVTQIIFLAVVLFSIILHELGHGYMAQRLGDPTARLAGRLTLNPIPHLDLIGSIVLPLLLFVTNAPFMFGWAKPVPYNPYNLRSPRWGESLVAAAGPSTNFLIAAIFGFIYGIAPLMGASAAFVEMAGNIILINVLLALFNSIPFPPLDGSKIIVPFLPLGAQIKYRAFASYIESMGFILLFVIIFIFIQIFFEPFFEMVKFVSNLLVWSF